MSGGHERKFLEEAGSSFAIPHEEEYFGDFGSVDLIIACGDLALKSFVAWQCLARKLELEDKEVKDSSTVVVASLQTRVAELEKLLAVEQDRSQRLQQEKENEVKTSQATLESLHTDMERLASAKEDLSVQLCNKDAELDNAKNKVGHLNDILESYRTQHVRSAEVLRSEVLELLAQCNLDTLLTTFLQCTVGSFYVWVSACFDLVSMNTKIFGELGAAVGVRTLAYYMCSMVPADCPSSEKTVSKSDLRRSTKDDYGWPSDAELDVSKLPVLAKNLAKNFMNTFFTEHGSRLTLVESVRLSAQVRRSDLCFRIDAFNCPQLTMMC
jgi:uncharacterized membrane protein YjjP (DUF1212 family)